MRKWIAISLTGLLGLMALLTWSSWSVSRTTDPAAGRSPEGAQVAAPEKPESPAANGAESSSVSESSRPPKKLLGNLLSTEGTALDTRSTAVVTARLQGRLPVGRVGTFATPEPGELGRLEKGQSITLTLPGGAELPGVVNLVLHGKDGIVRIGGGLLGGRGSFSLSEGAQGMGGRVVLQEEAKAYVLASVETGKVQMREMALSDVMCYPLAKADRELPQLAPPGTYPDSAPPEHRSRPGVSAVLYLDFDGATVTDPDWNNGNTVNAAPSTLQSYQITQVWSRVAEDFLPFNINVTTVESDYTNAPVGRRMRVIVTPTDSWYGDAGGVAYRDTFSAAGNHGFSSDVPCWVFNSSVDGVAEAISHELGHTLGLRHDGRSSPAEEYYEGHGGFGSVSWGPIMGASYNRSLVQWSRGEYAGANNQEDDVAIISGAQATPLYGYTNNTDYVADEAGDSRAAAAGFDLSTGQKSQTGVIIAASDSDFYAFTTSAPQMLSVSVLPADNYAKQPNLDVALELQDVGGTVLARANPADALHAEIYGHLLPAGSYYLRIAGTGRGNVQGDGYSNYGSIGHYRVSAQIFSAKPVITSASAATIGAGNSFYYQISATNTPTSFAVTGLPPGLTVNPGTGVISGRPEATGVFVANLSASNAVDTGTGTLTLTVTDAPPVVLTQTSGLQVVAAGGSSTLSVSGLSANGAISYQWMKDGRPVAGATGNTLTLNNASRFATGAYWLVMANAIGTTRSKPIFIRVASSATQVRAWGLNNQGQITVPNPLGQAVMIQAGGNHSMVVKSNGTLVGWGANNDGQLTAPQDLAVVVALSAATYHTLALKPDGSVASWGWGFGYGSQWNVPAGLTDVHALSAGSSHSLAVKTDGTVVGWGSTSNLPPAGTGGAVAVAAGDGFSLVLKSDGTVAMWGNPWSGQLGVPAGLTGVTAISAGASHALALKGDGTVVAWGNNTYGQASVPLNLSNVVAISAGLNFSMALKSDGTVVAWGDNNYGQLAVPGDLAGVWAISAGAYHGLALRDASGDGVPAIAVHPAGKTIVETESTSLSVTATGVGPFSYQWRKDGVNIAGANDATLLLTEITGAQGGNYDVVVTNHVGATISSAATVTVVPIPVITNQSALRQVVSPGATLSLSVAATGTGNLSYQWLRNGRVIAGATGSSYNVNPATYGDNGWYVVRITDSNGTRRSPAMFVTVAPTTTQIIGWGWGFSGGSSLAPTELTDAVAISAGGGGFSLVLRRDGSLAGSGYWGYYSPLPVSATGFVAIAAGYSHCLALKPDGTVVSWGYAGAVPAGLKDVVAIAAQSYMSYALKADGTVVGWDASTGQYLSLSPGITQGSGLTHSYVLRADGTVVKIQPNRPEVPVGLGDVKEIAGSGSHTLAIKGDGTMVAWDYSGVTSDGETTIPAGLNNVMSGATGYNHTVALKADGSVIVWGANSYGQTDVPSWLGKVFVVAANSDFSLALRDATQDAVPGISLQPSGQTVAELQTASFTVVASGAGPFTYQWRKNAVIIDGATSATLTLPEVLAADAGSYDVVITNHKGSTTSNAAVLTVVPLPVVTNLSPVRQVLIPGAALNLSVSATGVGPLSYQWIHNGRPIAGAIGTSYSRPGVTRADAGWYVVLITDSNGTRRTKTMFVTVAPAKTQLVQWGPLNSGNGGSPAPTLDDVTAIAIGGHQAVGIRADGSLVAWGNSSMYYPLGGYAGGYVAVAAAPYHTLMLRADGTVESGGYNQNVPVGLKDVVAIAAGYTRSFALKSDGTLVGWVNHQGYLDPAASGGTGMVAISAGASSALALKADGTLTAFPSNSEMALGLPAGLANVAAIATNGSVSAALKTDGTLQFWGSSSWGLVDVPAGITTAHDVKISDYHAMVLKSDGTVADWGTWGNPQVPAGLTDVWAIAAGSEASLVLRDATNDTLPIITSQPVSLTKIKGETAMFTVAAAGTGPLTYQWRRDGINLTNSEVVSGATGATLTLQEAQLEDAGAYTVVVSNYLGSVTSDPVSLTVSAPIIVTRPMSKVVSEGGTVVFDAAATGSGSLSYQWKHNGVVIAGATGPTLVLNNVTIAERGRYEVLVTDDNATTRSVFYLHVALHSASLVAWGRNDGGQTNVPANPGSLSVVRAGRNYGMAVKGDGTVLQWGNYAPAIPQGLTNVVDVSAGGAGQSYAIRSDGTVIGWGENSSGQLNMPAGLSDVVAVSSNMYHSIALKANGRVVTWGMGYYQGSGTAPAGLRDVVAVAAGSNHFMALKSDGTVTVWGQTWYGNQVAPANLDDVVAIAAADTYNMALRATGEVVLWGNTDKSVPGNLTNVTSIAAGAGHNLALKGDGSVSAWGYNGYGETTVPTDLGNAVMVEGGLNYSVALVPSGSGRPIITSHPPSQSASVGQNVSFTVAATGSGLSYQWKKGGSYLANGGNISGANSPTLIISDVQESDAGPYTVMVSNVSGSAVSTATLKVLLTPVITVRPLSRTAQVGQPVTFTSVAAGAGLTYQWKHNGKVISGATSATLSIPSVSMADRGRYEMIVTNTGGYSARTVFMFYPWSPNSWVRGWGWGNYGEASVPSDLGPVVNINAGGPSYAVKPDGTVTAWGLGNAQHMAVPGGLSQVLEVTSSGGHVVALKLDGTVVAWGNNSYGQTSVPAGLNQVVAIASGAYGHNLALKADGTVVAWGRSYEGQTNVPAGLVDVVAISAGQYKSFALKADGTVVGWGYSDYNPPTDLSGVVELSIGSMHGLALKQDGTVQAWGYGAMGQINVPIGLSGVSAISASHAHNLVLKSDGTIVGWGDNSAGRASVPAGLSGVFAITTAENYNLALLSNNLPPQIEAHPQDLAVVVGAVAAFTTKASGGPPLAYQWQRLPAAGGQWTDLVNGNGYGGVDTDELVIAAVTQALSGDQFRCVVSNPGGNSQTGSATLTVEASAGFVSVSAGYGHGLFVMKDGSLWGMGSNSAGQLGVSTLLGNTAGPNSPVLITTGVASVPEIEGYHSLILKTDGTLWGMGANSYGQLGDGTFGNSSVPLQIASGVRTASGGISHSLFVKEDGSLWAMGRNDYGQLGDGTTTQRHSPVQIASGVTAASVGSVHSLFVKTDGTLWAMGENSDGQLGDGTLTRRFSPVQIATGVVKVAAGVAHSFFIKSDGSLWAMGTNGSGQLGDGTTIRRDRPVRVAEGVVSVACHSHSLFIKTNGTLWGMGYNDSNQLGDGSGQSQIIPRQIATGVAAVAAGASHSMFIKTDGSIWAMGNGYAGQLGIGSYTWQPTPTKVLIGPIITMHPQSKTVEVETTVSFSVEVVGQPAPAYQWQRQASGSGNWVEVSNGGAYSGATTRTLTLSNVTLAANGDRFRCVVTGNQVTLTSNAAVLTAWSSKTAPDFNWDGKADLLLVNPVTGARAIQLLNGSSLGGLVDLGVVPLDFRLVGAVDFTGDGRPDIVWEHLTSGERGIWPMNGTQPGTYISLGTIPPDWRIAALADFNADTKTDLLLENPATGGRMIRLMNGTTQAGTVDLGIVSTDWRIVTAADLTSDGKPDIVWENTGSGWRGIWPMNGTSAGLFVSIGTITTDWQIAAVADYNADGKPDLLLQNVGSGQYGIRLLNGTTQGAWLDVGVLNNNWSLANVGLTGRSILSQPQSVTVNAGQNASFTVGVSAGPTPSYQWQRQPGGVGDWVNVVNGGAFSGATAASFAVTGTTVGMSGDKFRCVVTFASGPLNSGAAVLTVSAPPVVPDFNGDGKTDVLLVNQATGARAIQLLNGTSLGSQVALGTVPLDWRLAGAADFTGDGKADLVWENILNGTRGVWPMNGTTPGTFINLGTIAVDWQIAALADFNADGKTDLLLENVTTGARAVRLMNGTTMGSQIALGTVPLDWRMVGAADLTGDGKPDIVWENSLNGTRGAWPMNGTTAGTFINLGTITPDWQVTGVADYNGDGKPDLLLENAGSGQYGVRLMNGTTFGAWVDIGTLGSNWTLASVDFAAHFILTQPQAVTVGAGQSATFSLGVSAGSSPTYQWQRQAGGTGNWANVSNGGAYSGATTASLTLTGATLGMNGDKFRCVATFSSGPLTSSAATLTVSAPTNGITYGTNTFPASAAPGAVVTFTFTVTNSGTKVWGADHWLELKEANNTFTGYRSLNGVATGADKVLSFSFTAPSVSGTYVYRLRGLDNAVGYFGTQPTLTLTVVPLVGPDFNGDGKTDVLLVNQATGARAIQLLNGMSLGSQVALGTVPLDWRLAGAADLTGDGKPDLVWENLLNGTRGVWPMNGTTPGTFINLGTITTDWQIVGLADFNADGKTDLVLENTTSGARAVRLMNGTTMGSQVALGTVPLDWRIVGAADLTGDGKPDIVWENSLNGTRGVWPMNGTTAGTFINLGTLPTSLQVSSVADYNGDGKADLLMRNPGTGQYGVRLLNGTTLGTWTDIATLPASWILVR